MNCKRCNGSGYDPDPASLGAGLEGQCSVCNGHGEEPCVDCGGSGVDFDFRGDTRPCHCRLARVARSEKSGGA